MGEYSIENRIFPIQDECQPSDYELNPRRSKRLHRKAIEEESQLSGIESPTSNALTLSLVLQEQGPGQPKHWVLFVARENQPGMCYQVIGDALCMKYWASEKPIDIKATKSYWNTFELSTITEEEAAMVGEIASQERLPRARDWSCVKENCQGWTLRVLMKLNERGIVAESEIKMVKSMKESI